MCISVQQPGTEDELQNQRELNQNKPILINWLGLGIISVGLKEQRQCVTRHNNILDSRLKEQHNCT